MQEHTPEFIAEGLEWNSLPARLCEIKEIAGPQAALSLAQRYGGASVYVPVKATAGHPLSKLLGMRAAGAISRVYGGDRLEVPKTDSIARQIRGKKIRRRRLEGASISILAAEFNLSRRRILQILAAK